MKTIILKKVKEILSEIGGGEAFYIYGAKTVAQRTYRYLTANGRTDMSGYLVSAKYDNPDQIDGVDVLRIENCKDRPLKNVIIAVIGQAIWSIADDLKQYNIENLFILSPFIIDDFPLKDILSENCSISKEAVVSPNVQIFADETSRIIIRDHVIINDDVKIFAMGHSQIEIGEETTIDRDAFINAEASQIDIGDKSSIGSRAGVSAKDASSIIIGENVKIGNECNISALSKSTLVIGEKTGIAAQTSIGADVHSSIKIGTKLTIGDKCIIGAGDGGSIQIGNDTTINSYLYLGAAASKVSIGEGCMFSFFVKMNTGSHTLFDNVTGENISHRDGITLGDHVWVGMGATFVDGCTVGDGSVIGASSVVTKDIPSHVTCAGNPVRVLREVVRWERETE